MGKIIAAGFGDRVAIGLFMALWDNVTPARVYEYIRDALKLGYKISDSDWKMYSKMAKSANIGDITTERVIGELRDRLPDLLGVILNHPGGMDWLDGQVAAIKERLGIG